MNTLVENLRQAKALAKTRRSKHIELRQSYLENLAMSIAVNKHPFLAIEEDSDALRIKAGRELKNLIKREQRRRSFTRIGHVLETKSMHTGLARVDVPAGDTRPFPEGPDPKTWEGPWTPITTPNEIAEHVCSANTRQYQQAISTPFASGPLADYLGPRGESKGAIDLLNGTLPPQKIIEHLHPETMAILGTLVTPPTLKSFKSTAQITQADFIGTYKASKELTSSSPSGRHIGHYKAVIDDCELVEIHSSMMSLPHQNGFSPSRWQKVVDIMLEKQLGVPKIHRLRIIALMESDFNHSNRILFGRQLGFYMEDNNLVSEMQFGSRPGKQCTSAVLHKLLCYDITRHTKETAAFIENDAVGCFDRMVNNLLILCLQRLGMKPSATQSLGLTWAQCIHYIRTQFGISSQSYRNTSNNPLFGPGQGSTIGPFLWIICYCLMVDSMRKDIPKFNAVSSVDRKRSLQLGLPL